MQKLKKRVNLIQYTMLEFMSICQQYMPPEGQDAVNSLGNYFNGELDEIHEPTTQAKEDI